MWGRLGPRFALEATFLVLVAVGLAIADLEPIPIVAVMAGAWLLVSLIELIASRRPMYHEVSLPVVETQPAPAPVVEPEPAPAVEAAVEAVPESASEPADVEVVEPVEEPSPPPERRSFFGRRKARAPSPEVAAATARDPDADA